MGITGLSAIPLQHALDRLAHDPHEAAMLGENGPDTVEHITWEHVCATLLNTATKG